MKKVYVKTNRDEEGYADFYSFNTLEECIAWIIIESIEDYEITDIPSQAEDYYTLINDELYKLKLGARV